MRASLSGKRFPRKRALWTGWKANDLPAGLGDAGEISGQSALAEAEPGRTELLQDASASAGELAAAAEANRAGVSSHLVKTDSGGEAFFFAERRIDSPSLELLAFFPVLGNEDFAFLLTVYHRLLCHITSSSLGLFDVVFESDPSYSERTPFPYDGQ